MKEKEIIDKLKELQNDSFEWSGVESLIDFIKKLQKENEELKNKVFKREKEIIELEEYANKNFARKDDVKAKYIPKDKIRKKLKAREEDIEDCDNSIIANNLLRDIYLLRELLEEE